MFTEVAEGQRSTHGVFECQYFAVNHSIPDALALAVHTGAGTVLHTGDIKLDQLPLDGRPTDLPAMSRLGDAGIDLRPLLQDDSQHEALVARISALTATKAPAHRLHEGNSGGTPHLASIGG